MLCDSAKRRITLLEGDAVRLTLSGELGFSREHRAINLRRIAFVAAAVARHGGIALCAAIAPCAGDPPATSETVEAAG